MAEEKLDLRQALEDALFIIRAYDVTLEAVLKRGAPTEFVGTISFAKLRALREKTVRQIEEASKSLAPPET
jgi:hypothetical protein